MINECSVCYKQNVTLGCSKCRRVYYCSREHQLMVWYAHKKICANTVNVNTMIPQPPLTHEEFGSYSITGVGKVAANGLPQLEVHIHPLPIPDFLQEATKQRTLALLASVSSETRNNMLASLRSRNHHDVPDNSPVVELTLQFQDRYRYLRPFYSVAGITVDIDDQDIEPLDGFIPALFNIACIRNSISDPLVFDSLQIHHAALDVTDQRPLIMGGFSRLQSITDTYKAKVGNSKSWKFYARTLAELEYNVSLILINHASAARSVDLVQKHALEVSTYEKYIQCTKEFGGPIIYRKPLRSREHYSLPAREMLPGETIGI